MTYFVCDLLDLEGHGRAVVGGDRNRSDLIQAALNDYEKQGLMLVQTAPGEQLGDQGRDRSHQPLFIFHKADHGKIFTLDEIEQSLDG